MEANLSASNWGIFGVRVIFPDWGCVQQSAPYWTVKLYFEVFRKQQVMFPSGKPFSGHLSGYGTINTINGHVGRSLVTFYYLTT